MTGSHHPRTFDRRGHGHFLRSREALIPPAPPCALPSGSKAEDERLRSWPATRPSHTSLSSQSSAAQPGGLGYTCLIVTDPWWRVGLVHSRAQQTALECAQRRLCVACSWITPGSSAITNLLPVHILARVLQQGTLVEEQTAEADSDGRTALYLAAEHNHTTALELQLACGAHMNQPSTEAGDTPLMTAARCGSTEAVSLLLECGVNWRQQNNNGSTALQLAELHAQVEAVDHLQSWLVHHSEDSELLDFYNQRLRRAAADGDITGLRALLTCGADIDDADQEGSTALHLAAEFGREEAVQLLVDEGADLEACDDTGQTPLVRSHIHARCCVVACYHDCCPRYVSRVLALHRWLRLLHPTAPSVLLTSCCGKVHVLTARTMTGKPR